MKCNCGFTGDVFAKVADLDAKGRLPCPECGERAEQDYAAKQVSAHGDEVHGAAQITPEVRCSPEEVATLRKRFGDGTGHCWQDNGRVKFKDKTEARKFFNREQSIKRRAQDKADAKGA